LIVSSRIQETQMNFPKKLFSDKESRGGRKRNSNTISGSREWGGRERVCACVRMCVCLSRWKLINLPSCSIYLLLVFFLSTLLKSFRHFLLRCVCACVCASKCVCMCVKESERERFSRFSLLPNQSRMSFTPFCINHSLLLTRTLLSLFFKRTYTHFLSQTHTRFSFPLFGFQNKSNFLFQESWTNKCDTWTVSFFHSR